ncbi:MAG TPA: OmpA family protein [Candidatus Sulfotelmatobacter sp.]|nr:OmpA family protein [Candidatus Sulfotelmatobacter sp.]
MKILIACFLCVASYALAQSPATSATASGAASASAPTVSRTTKAVHYRLQGGMTKVDFQGTDLLKTATGEAKVEGKKTNLAIDVKFQGLEEATKFGLEYLTYVLWAVSPEGRPVNLGEVTLEHNGNAHIKAATDLQTFGMIVTAEPYFAVTQPGNMVVMESSPMAGAGTENIEAKYELVTRGTYSSTNTHIQDAIFGVDNRTPLELFEARNALRIAHIAAADKYATTILAKADGQLRQAEEAYRQKQVKTSVEAAAKEATQTAEEARMMAVKQKAEDEAQAAAAAREAKARADAEAEAKRRADAEQARAQADQARIAAEQAKADAERMKQEAQAAAAEAARQKAEAEQAKADAIAQQQALAAEADKARAAAAQSENLRQQAETMRQQAEKEKQELRARLLQQLNTILATRDSARGLIANMSDVLFRSGSFELLPGARERLAKVSGIVLAYPSLHLAVEGHTDSIGSDEYNQQLSEHRAEAVRDYLVQQGINANSIEAHGYGKTEPIASNDTSEGRQQNRRVELVLSGDAIGNTTESAQPASQTATSADRQ